MSFTAQAHKPVEVLLPAWGIAIAESHHAQDFRAEVACHNFLQLLYPIRGAGSLHIGEATHSFETGDCAIISPQAPHCVNDDSTTPISLYAVNITPQLLIPFPGIQTFVSQPRRLRHPTIAEQMPDILRRLLYEQSLLRPGCDAMMTSFVLQMLCSLLRIQSTRKNPSVESEHSSMLQARVASYVQELERDFYVSETIDQVAARLGVSRRHFTELFRAQTGSAWLPYLRHLRIEHAKQLLSHSQRTITSIGFECGYEDFSSFYRAFRHETGLSPDAWRRKNS